MYDSQDIATSFIQFNASYRILPNDGIPLELTVQQMAINTLAGRLFRVSFVWSSDNIADSQCWCEKIAALRTMIVNTVMATIIPD